MKIFYKTAIAFIIAALPATVLAGGWPVKKGNYLVSVTASYFRASQLWDKGGRLGSYEQGGYFESRSLSLYGEYGITRRLTGVVSLPYIINEFKRQDMPAATSQGLGDMEFGVRYYLTNINFKYYFAIQGMAIAPLYSDTSLGFSSGGAEVRAIGSGSGKIGSKNYYMNLEVGGRQYFQNAGPFQVRYTGAFGLNFDKHNQLALGVSGNYSTSINKILDENLVLNKDFSYTQGSFSYAYIVNPKLSFFAGVNQFLVGRSTGKGTTFSLSVITKF
ncbi:hypothetical protein LT679_10650 [Mucilaginibacter roseus]|uniref:Transporter n=1 Tax=Mucilaginibacter roseus TaxID=1528868 RepID=A0ABS8U669_9SPHI|nr:hypothetical protein [Mucilaginibacter roseus]MCD8741061.1 hypothetical protein [Mucilaginibacter roseus]